jgi:hypothetical protein
MKQSPKGEFCSEKLLLVTHLKSTSFREYLLVLFFGEIHLPKERCVKLAKLMI